MKQLADILALKGNAEQIAAITQQIENHKSIYFSTSEPTSEDGQDGDLWFVFAPLVTSSPSLSFNGTTSYVEIPHDSAISGFTTFTCECWVTIAELNRRQVFVSKYDTTDNQRGYLVNMNETYFHCIYSVDGSDTVIRGATSGVFGLDRYHLAFTFDNGTSKLYINGQLQVINAFVGEGVSIYDNTLEPLFLGKSSYDETRGFNGILKDVRIWNVARTQAQIQANMNIELDGDESGLVGYWKLNEGEGTTAYDSTSNENHGTIYNGTWTEA